MFIKKTELDNFIPFNINKTKILKLTVVILLILMPVMSFAQDQNMHMSVSMSGQNTMLPDSNKTADQKNSIVSSASRDSSFSGGSVIVDRLSARQRPRGFFGMIGHGIKAFFREFTNFDTTYIEPQKYNYAFLLQNTNTYEAYSFSSREGKRISFSPDMSYKLGPYFGWKWLFLGYSIDLTHLGSTSLNDNRTEYDLSLYSNMLGLDLFWRETGNNYKVRSVDLGSGINTHDIKNSDFSGLHSSIRGFSGYYIFNHRHFSYPAAYSQSTIQRRSSGSLLAGVGYTYQKIFVDWQQMRELIAAKVSTEAAQLLDTTFRTGVTRLEDINISAGYAYNWVFAHNWLFDISLQLGLAYKDTRSDMQADRSFRDFSFHNFQLDGTGRTALVYNNMKWFAGLSATFHAYNYSKNRFSTSNIFGNLIFYAGFNFGRKKEYRNRR